MADLRRPLCHHVRGPLLLRLHRARDQVRRDDRRATGVAKSTSLPNVSKPFKPWISLDLAKFSSFVILVFMNLTETALLQPLPNQCSEDFILVCFHE